MSDRINRLLAGVGKDLEEGITPLNQAFLLKYDVTLDECFDIMGQLSLAITVYLGLFTKPMNTQLVGTVLGTGLFERNRLS